MKKFKLKDFKVGDFVILNDSLFTHKKTNIRIKGYDKYLTEYGRITQIIDSKNNLIIDDCFGADLDSIVKIITSETHPEYFL